MPQEFIPREEYTSHFQKFELLNFVLDHAEKFNQKEWLMKMLEDWPMPNGPIRSEN